MKLRILFPVALCLVLVAPRYLRADAAGDLAAGRAALEAGELDKAQTLLSAAVQALPNSVEANFALAECHVKLGDLEKALARYRNVLRISPEHVAAKRIVAALAGERATLDEQIASARALVEVGVFATVEPVLRKLLSEPLEPAQRASARLLLVEASLWNGAAPAAVTEALRVMQESQDPKLTGPARVIAALALLQIPEPQADKSAEILKTAGELAAPWSARSVLARTLAQLDEPSKAAENSTALIAGLGAVPVSPYRGTVVERATKSLLPIANARLGQGDAAAAVTIVWPMVSGQAVPAADAVLKPVEASGGWLPKYASTYRIQVSSVLAATGKADFDRSGANARLLGYWLAAEVLRQTTPDDAAANEQVRLAATLVPLSRAAHDRKPGTPLSAADQIQRALLLQAATRATTDQVRQAIVDQIVAHMERYRAAGDEETGLAQFLTIDAAAKPQQVKLVAELDHFPPGMPHFNLLHTLATAAMNLGHKAFQEAAATFSPDANVAVNKFDAAAISLLGQSATLYPTEPSATTKVGALIDRYAAASKWGAATEAAGLFYGPQNGEAVRWALVTLKMRQAMVAENRWLDATRQLGKELSPAVKEILADALKVLEAYPGRSSRSSAAGVASNLIERYSQLQCIDLADAVIAAVSAPPAGANLADWALWVRAGLLERQAAQALLLASGTNETNVGPALHDMHKAELALLSELITKHPKSEFLGASIERVVHIANLYQNYRSFDVARAVVTEFLKAHPKLAAAERLEYQSVQIALDKARLLFSERKDQQKTPDKLSDEFAAALDALAAYLKAHPTGDHAPAAEGELLAVARTYGEVGAWPISRDVLTRLATAVPDFSSPAHLKFLQAATFLGELDRAYGLALLTPSPKPSATSGSGDFSDVAANERPTTGTAIGGKPKPTTPKGDLATKNPVGAPSMGGGGAGGFGLPGSGPGGVPGIPAPVIDPSDLFSNFDRPAKPSETALAMIKQSQQRQFQQIAMLEGKGAEAKDMAKLNAQQAVALPSGPVLSAAETKRQDAAADKAYALLIELVKSPALADAAVAAQARAQVLWLFGFFEGQMRPDRAIVYIKQYLKDRPTDPARIGLAMQAINDQLAFAEMRQPTDRINQAWLDQRHLRFEEARKELAAFIKAQAEKKEWSQRARLIVVDSYDREANLAAAVSSVRAGGLLVQGAEALLELLNSSPNHAEKASFPQRLWNLADRLCAFGQEEQSIYVLSQIPIRFPTDALANQAVLRIAQLHATQLADPLKAIETYQEYLSLAGDDESVRANIFAIAQQLAAKQRYVESLHVYGVFVDSFPTDPRAAEALRAIGLTHQTNEVWEEAIKVYQRILDEYPGVPTLPQVKLAMAECQINLSQWRTARSLYEEYAAQHPKDSQTPMVLSRMAVLKNLDKFETLIADGQVQRNKDDAQFQIGRIVIEQLQNPVKAVTEFRKVVSKFPKSDLADDAQLEIGKALLTLNKLDDARKELLSLPAKFPNSPLADDALYLVGQSYEQQGIRLAGITAEKAKAEAFELGQRSAYRRFNEQVAGRGDIQQQRRDALKKSGDEAGLALDEARNAATELNFLQEGISNTAKFAQQQAETESALEVANRQDRINDAYREAVAMYVKAAADYPLGDKTDDSLLKIAQIFETHLKDRKSAMETYQKIVKLFPGTPVAEDAAWKVAQFHERESKYTAAADAYRDFIRNYPGSARVAEAQFALAEVLEQLGNWVDAMDAYETFRQKFGSHPKATLAMEQINWIKAYRK